MEKNPRWLIIASIVLFFGVLFALIILNINIKKNGEALIKNQSNAPDAILSCSIEYKEQIRLLSSLEAKYFLTLLKNSEKVSRTGISDRSLRDDSVPIIFHFDNPDTPGVCYYVYFRITPFFIEYNDCDRAGIKVFKGDADLKSTIRKLVINKFKSI